MPAQEPPPPPQPPRVGNFHFYIVFIAVIVMYFLLTGELQNRHKNEIVREALEITSKTNFQLDKEKFRQSMIQLIDRYRHERDPEKMHKIEKFFSEMHSLTFIPPDDEKVVESQPKQITHMNHK